MTGDWHDYPSLFLTEVLGIALTDDQSDEINKFFIFLEPNSEKEGLKDCINDGDGRKYR